MSNHRLRIWESDTIYVVSNRCFQSQCLLRPDDAVNPLVVAWLRRTVRIYGLELFAAMVLGDRFILILRAPRKNLSQAMGYFQGNLAKGVNRLRGRKDTVFPDRFDAAPILGDALVDEVRRLLRAPVKQTEVAKVEEWPGYTTWHQMTQEESSWMAGDMELPPLTKLPCWAELDDSEYAQRVRALGDDPLLEHEDDAALWPALPAVGAAAVRERDWRSRSSGPRPSRRRRLCHTSRPALARAYRARCRKVRNRYDVAMTMWRQGRATVFPAGTFPPGWCEVSDGKEPAEPPAPEQAEVGT